jgi:hypothetical protein
MPTRGISSLVLLFLSLACGGKTKTEPGGFGGSGTGPGATTGNGSGGSQGCPATGCTTTTVGGGGSADPATTTSTTSTTTGAGGTGGCGDFAACQSKVKGICPAPNGCECADCACELDTCLGDAGCRAVYSCVARNHCTNAGNCASKCYTELMSNQPSIPIAMSLLSCLEMSGCDAVCDGPVVDAGPACAPPPLPVGFGGCGLVGSPSEPTCGQSCFDSVMNQYQTRCSAATRSCECVYDGKLLCSCTYSDTTACRDCCPPWHP